MTNRRYRITRNALIQGQHSSTRFEGGRSRYTKDAVQSRIAGPQGAHSLGFTHGFGKFHTLHRCVGKRARPVLETRLGSTLTHARACHRALVHLSVGNLCHTSIRQRISSSTTRQLVSSYQSISPFVRLSVQALIEHTTQGQPKAVPQISKQL